MTADARDDDTNHALQELPRGTRFGELEILGTLGVGGFGIVYLARDHALEREIAIKEYMPCQFAQRNGRSQVSVRSAAMRETFELGRRSFVNEARLLARFDHPSLLKVYRFWEANGTAYMAMPRLAGSNLREARKALATPPPEAWARRVFDAVLGGLETLHAQQVWHRDVAPDNIFLPADGAPPILLDFGAARQTIGDRTQAFTAILKPSFAPIEQYAEAASLKQGPWTDFYALAAVMHELLTGHPPPPATARAMCDERLPLAVPGYAPSFLAALDWALRVPPHQRPASAAAWRAVADGRAVVPWPQPVPPRPVAPPPAPERPAAPVDIAFADTVQALPEGLQQPARAAPVRGPVPPPAAERRRGLLLLGAAGLLALLLLGLFVRQLRQHMARPAPPELAIVGMAASAASEPAASAPVVSVALPPPVETAQAVPVPASRPLAAAPLRREAAAKPVLVDKPAEVQRLPRPAAVAAPEPSTHASALAAEPRTPLEACANRALLARLWCIDRQCERPQFRNDPECLRLREIREQRNAQREGH